MAVQKFAQHSKRGLKRTSEPKPHENLSIASVLSNPKFAKGQAETEANFGFGTLAMCMMCEDEASYKAYMEYLDAAARQVKDGTASADEAIDALLDRLEAEDRAKAEAAARPENDKTLSPFFCSPVNK